MQLERRHTSDRLKLVQIINDSNLRLDFLKKKMYSKKYNYF